VALDIEDLAGTPEPEAVARACAEHEAARPFDLAAELPWRMRVLRVGVQCHWILFTCHHIVWDGWSAAIFARELSALYRAARSGDVDPLPPLPIQYADYAVWQREWLQGAVLDEQLAYWRQALAELPTLELPLDYARPAQPSHRGERIAFTIEAELTQALRRLARSENATLFMTLLAAFDVLLYR